MLCRRHEAYNDMVTLMCRSMDAPLAPKLLGGVVGRALAEGVLPAAALTELASPIESAEPRRAFVVESLTQVKVRSAGWNIHVCRRALLQQTV
jgi:hypothetical protein